MRLPRAGFVTRRRLVYPVALTLACIGLAWLVRIVQDARGDALSAQCAGRLSQLALAMHNYEAMYGCFPPVFVADAEGRPLYSWSVLLAAELDRSEKWLGGELVGRFRFDEPWDSPNNRTLHHLDASFLRCPANPEHAERGLTSYVAVVGPGMLFPGDGASRSLSDVDDGAGRTLMLIESSSSSTHWMEPVDLEWDRMSWRLNDATGIGPSSHHRPDGGPWPGVHAVTVGGDLVYLVPPLPEANLRAMFTIAGGEAIDPPSRRADCGDEQDR